MKIFDASGNELMNVREIARDGNRLVIRGKIMGAMPMTAQLTPEEARAGFKLLNARTLFFLLTILFRRSAKK